jgi:hypothetical protein
MQQQQEEELVRPAAGKQGDLVVVDNMEDPKGKETTKALPAIQLDKDRFRLRGIRAQQLAEHKTETT